MGATPITNLNAIAQKASSITVISLPRSLPAEMTKLDLSAMPTTTHVRNLHNIPTLIPHATAAQLKKTSNHHGLHADHLTNQTLWSAYLEEQLFAANVGGLAATVIDLSDVEFSSTLATAQSQVNAFFAALNLLMTEKANVENIHFKFPDALDAGTLVLGKSGPTTYASGLNADLRVSAQKHANLMLEGVGFISTSETAQLVATPIITDVAANWTAWMNQRIAEGKTELDLSALAFSAQAEIDEFFAGLEAAANKANIKLIRLGIAAAGAYTDPDTAALGTGTTNLNANLHIICHGGAGVTISEAGDIKADNIHAHHATVPTATDPDGNLTVIDHADGVNWPLDVAAWAAWINHEVANGKTHLHLGMANAFTAQNEVDAFFAGLEASPHKHRIQRIYMDLTGNMVGALKLGATSGTGTTAATGLASNLHVFTYGKPANEMSAVGGAWGTLHADHIITTPIPLNAVATDWKNYINANIDTSNWHLDVRDVSFTTQGQLDLFFEGVRDAETNKRFISRIDLDLTGMGAGTYIFGQDSGNAVVRGLNTSLNLLVHNADVVGGVTVQSHASQYRDAIHAANLHVIDAANAAEPAKTAAAAAWETYFNHHIVHGTQHIDLWGVGFATQAQVDTMFEALNTAHHKHAVKSLILGLDGALAAQPLVLGQATGDVRVTGLNPNLKAFVTAATPSVLTGVGTTDTGEVASIIEDGVTPPADKTKASEWRSYILHSLGSGRHALDLKDIPLANDAEVIALQTALMQLPAHDKTLIRSIVIKLAGGHLDADSFATDKLMLDLSAVGLTNLDHLIVDLNETIDGLDAATDPAVRAVVGAGITLPASASLIETNPYIKH